MCILVVEDEDLIRLLITEELAEAGYVVLEAENGDRAATLIQTLTTTFRLLITDIHMPGQLDGLAVARLMRARYPDTPIIYTTGRPDVVEAAVSLDENEVLLPKPYSPSELLQATRCLLAASHQAPKV